MRVALIGAGWGGLAAAVAATGRGHAVTVFEAARVPGGRARTLPVRLPDGGELLLDNGQHILIGAYLETLKLMERVGVRLDDALVRLPLALRHPDGSGLALPSWPSPLDAAAGILTARGWSWRDKLSLLRASLAWQRGGFRCAPEASVADLCARLTPRVRAELIEPLCVSALNTPAARSSGAVFLRVLRDALFGRGHGRWGGSNLLLPKQDLGRLFPKPPSPGCRGMASRCGWASGCRRSPRPTPVARSTANVSTRWCWPARRRRRRGWPKARRRPGRPGPGKPRRWTTKRSPPST
jgi:predicted NAD/FAD-binding protein